MALTQISTQGIKDGTITGTDLTTNVDLVDNQKLRLGTGNDLQIYHTGSNSFIDDQGTGNFYIKSNRFEIANANGLERMAKFIEDGAVELYYDNVKKLETTANGVEVTGSIFLAGKIDMGDSSSTTTGRILLGTGDDLQIYHSGSHSYIADEGVGELIISGSRVQLMNAARSGKGLDFVEGSSGYLRLYQNNNIRLETLSSGVKIIGLNATGSSVLGDFRFKDQDDNLDVHYDAENNKIQFLDNNKATFGTGDDLQIFHDGANSLIDDAGTGILGLRSENGINFYKRSNNEFLLKAIPDGAVELYYDNSKKFETTSSGIQISGHINLPDQASGTGKIKFGDGNDLQIYHDGSNSRIHDGGTGVLAISGSEVHIQNAAQSENLARFIQNAEVRLYYDNTKRFETLSNGAQVQGRLAVGDDNAPETTFQVTATAAGAVYPMLLKNRTNGNAAVGMRFIATGADLSDGDFASIEAGHGAVGSTNHEFRFKTCHSGTVAEKIRILSSGGITFNGDSATANALDDYEEGSLNWELAKSGTPSLGSNNGSNVKYVKVGRLVHISGRIRTDSCGSAGGDNFVFQSGSTLPFTPETSGTSVVGHWRSQDQTDKSLTASIAWVGSSTTLYLYTIDAKNDYAADTNNVPADSQTNLVITFSLTYRANS